jgi:hypothetical protein
MARLPKLLMQAQLAQFLSAFDPQTASGRRGYAIARLLVDLDLGLRGEVAAFCNSQTLIGMRERCESGQRSRFRDAEFSW